MSLGVVVAGAIILWSAIRTVSYGIWTCKNKNKLGSIMIFILVIAMVILPIYTMFLR